jgi:DEAD/DEAH box helicase domain-containing protein
MLPSLLARDIQNGLKQFLLTGFEPSDDFFHGLMQRFVDEESAWMKGPYLQVGLPFRIGASGRKFFGHFETQYPGYVHQEAAWLRLASNQQAANTLVATGTGSGKTECFLYPLLDHASRAKAAGEQGIKALVIYPMNALASDQARRIAELVDKVPAFKGLRVGLFVGGQAGLPGSGSMMTAGSVITDRETLRRAPPDILLTNYKMLDYLLIRPRDRKLWEKNTPTTLRYVVVDELHTFDGAQGTDLALLLRRLRARLQTPEGHLVCAGTSATLGGSTDTQPLRDYAEQIFGSAFPPDSVVTENRKSVAEFLGDATIEHVLQWQEGTEALLLPLSVSVSAWAFDGDGVSSSCSGGA